MLMGVSSTWIPIPAICLHTCCVTLGQWPAPSEETVVTAREEGDTRGEPVTWGSSPSPETPGELGTEVVGRTGPWARVGSGGWQPGPILGGAGAP